MTDSRRADLIVIGLGPAGASAAIRAAGAGLRVIAVDHKRAAGLPVQCAEFVPGPLASSVANLTRPTRQTISQMVTYVSAAAPNITDDFRGSMIDRATFDAMLVAEAGRAGAEICFGSGVAAFDAGGVRLSNGRRLEAPIVIGADGPRSVAGRAIGARNTEFVETRQITVPLRGSHSATDIFLYPEFRGGYAWLFPKGDVAHIGLGVEPPCRNRLKPLLDQLHSRLVQEGRVGPERLALTGGAIAVGGMLRALGECGGCSVLLAGDAAGLTNPVTGAGIASAVQSGAMAGAAAVALHRGAKHAGSDYADELNDLFGPSLDRAVARRRELLACSANSAIPNLNDIRRGWIAFPEYWAPLRADRIDTTKRHCA